MNMQGGSNDALPRQVTIKQASKIWGIPEWTLRKYVYTTFTSRLPDLNKFCI